MTILAFVLAVGYLAAILWAVLRTNDRIRAERDAAETENAQLRHALEERTDERDASDSANGRLRVERNDLRHALDEAHADLAKLKAKRDETVRVQSEANVRLLNDLDAARVELLAEQVGRAEIAAAHEALLRKVAAIRDAARTEQITRDEAVERLGDALGRPWRRGALSGPSEVSRISSYSDRRHGHQQHTCDHTHSAPQAPHHR